MCVQNFAVKEFNQMKFFMGRLPHGKDLISSIEDFCAAMAVTTGVFSVIGALSSATVGAYDQRQQVFVTDHMDKALAILSCTGNISLQDGKPVAHAHFSLVDMEGRIFGGHALSDSKIFAGEVHLTALSGEPLERIYDPTTGLMLWNM